MAASRHALRDVLQPRCALQRRVARWALATLSLGWPARTVAAPPSSTETGKAPKEGTAEPSLAGTDEAAILDAGLAAWRRGDWTRVRGLLEPLVRDGSSLSTPLSTETALRHLADATLLDTALDANVRNELARGYVERLLDEDPAWAPPPSTHGPALYALVDAVRQQREQSRAANCEVERAACTADYKQLDVAHEELQQAHRKLQLDFDAQYVETREYVARNRAVALVPFGVGHFTNGRRGLGAGFLVAEVALGGTALSLLLTRTFAYDCERTAGFRPGSLQCSPPPDVSPERVVAVRNAEQTIGLLFLGTLVADVVVGQILFEPYAQISAKRVPRRELDADAAPTRGPKRGTRRRDAARLHVSPSAGPTTRGFGFGVRLRF